MSTDLQRQLAEHRSKHVYSTTSSVTAGLQPSLFLSLKDAAAVDISTVHEAALKHANILLQYEPRLAPFINGGVLHESSTTYQRQLKTQAENKALDRQLSQLIELLSLFASERSAHVVLEYLIRRFSVHEHNTHVLLTAFLHVHDTKIFARLLQLCHLDGSSGSTGTGSSAGVSGTAGVWSFLQPLKASGVPPTRTMLVRQAAKDPLLLQVLVDVAGSCKRLYNNNNASATRRRRSSSSGSADGEEADPSASSRPVSDLAYTGITTKLSFFAACVLELVPTTSSLGNGSGLRRLNDQQMRILYPALLDGLLTVPQGEGAGARYSRLEVETWRVAIMLLAHICASGSTVLSAALVQALMHRLVATTAELLRCLRTIASDYDDDDDDEEAAEGEAGQCRQRVDEALSLLCALSSSCGNVSLQWTAFSELLDAEGEGEVDDHFRTLRQFVQAVRRFGRQGFQTAALSKLLMLCLLRRWKGVHTAAAPEGKEGEEPATSIRLVGQALGLMVSQALLEGAGKEGEEKGDSATSAPLLLYLVAFVLSISSGGANSSADAMAATFETSCKVLQQVSQRHPLVFNAAVQQHLQQAISKGEGSATVTKLLQVVFCGRRHEEPTLLKTGTASDDEDVGSGGAKATAPVQVGSMLLAVQHALPVVRLQGAQAFLDHFAPSSDSKAECSAEVLRAVLKLFADRNAEVTRWVWGHAEELWAGLVAHSGGGSLISPTDVLDCVRVSWDELILSIAQGRGCSAETDTGATLLLLVQSTLCNTTWLDFVFGRSSASSEAAQGYTNGVSAECWMLMATVRLLRGIVPSGLLRGGEKNAHAALEAALRTSGMALFRMLGREAGQGQGQRQVAAKGKGGKKKASEASTAAAGDVYVGVFRHSGDCTPAEAIAANLIGCVDADGDDALATMGPWVSAISTAHSFISFASSQGQWGHHGWGYVASLSEQLMELGDAGADEVSVRQVVIVSHLQLLLRLRHTPLADILSVDGAIHQVLTTQCAGPLFGTSDTGVGAGNLGARVLLDVLGVVGPSGGARLVGAALSAFYRDEDAYAALSNVAFDAYSAASSGTRTISHLNSDWFLPMGATTVHSLWGTLQQAADFTTTEGCALCVTPSARIGAIVATVVLCNLNSCTAEVGSLFPLLLTACADGSKEVRTSATTALTLAADKLGGLDADRKVTETATVGDLQVLVLAVVGAADAVVNDDTAAADTVSTTMTACGVTVAKRLTEYLQHSAVTIYHWAFPATTTLLLRVTQRSSSPEALWATVKQLLDKLPTDGQAHDELQQLLVDAIPALFANCKGDDKYTEVQREVIQWVLSTVSEGAKMETQSPAIFLLHSLLPLLGDETADSAKWTFVFDFLSSAASSADAARQFYSDVTALCIHAGGFNRKQHSGSVRCFQDRRVMACILRRCSGAGAGAIDAAFVDSVLLQPFLEPFFQAVADAAGEGASFGDLGLALDQVCGVLELMQDCYGSPLSNATSDGNSSWGLLLAADDPAERMLSKLVGDLTRLLHCCTEHRASLFATLVVAVEHAELVALEIMDSLLAFYCRCCKSKGKGKGKSSGVLALLPPVDGATTKARTPSKKKTAKVTSSAASPSDTINDHICTVLRCIHQCRMSSIEAAGMQCLQTYYAAYSLCVAQGGAGAQASTALVVRNTIETLSSLLAEKTLESSRSSGSGGGLAQQQWSSSTISQILATLLSVTSAASEGVDGSSGSEMLVDILAGYTDCFGALPQEQRVDYLSVCLQTLLSHSCSGTTGCSIDADLVLPACVSVLMTHCYASTAAASAQAKVIGANDAAQEDEETGPGFILLSRAAARGAQGRQLAGHAEQFFQLAVQVTTACGGGSESEQLTALIRVGSGKSAERDTVSNMQLRNLVHLMGRCTDLLDLALLLRTDGGEMAPDSTTLKLSALATRKISGTESMTPVPPSGSSAALLLLHLEYVHAVLENRSFHRYVAHRKQQEQRRVTAMEEGDGEEADGSLQGNFLELFEHLLELYSAANATQQAPEVAGKEDVEDRFIEMPGAVTGSSTRIPAKALGGAVRMWCLKLIQSLQRLMDTPSFIAMLLELLGGDEASLREHAVVILTDRLDRLIALRNAAVGGSSKKQLGLEAERELLMDLFEQLRTTVIGGITDNLLVPAKGGQGARRGKVASDASNNSNSFVQSALMCLDMLTRYLSNGQQAGSADTAAFGATCMDALTQLLQCMEGVTAIITGGAGTENYNNALKVAGSLYLCVSTLAAAVAAASTGDTSGRKSSTGGSGSGAVKLLPHLSSMMGQMLAALACTQERCRDIIESDGAAVSVARSHLLVLRSIFAALSAMYTSVSAYLHPFLHATTSTLLAAYENFSQLLADTSLEDGALASEARSVLEDAEYLLTSCLKHVPPRLALPVLLKNLSPAMSQGQDQTADGLATAAYMEQGPYAVHLLAQCLGAVSIQQQYSSNLGSSTRQVMGPPLNNIAVLLLDYRRLAIAGADGVSVDGAMFKATATAAACDTVCRCVADLCLKWTEGELNGFISRLVLWKDAFSGTPSKKGPSDAVASVPASSWSRPVIFYQFMSVLSSRLQALFGPILGTLVWPEIVTTLQAALQTLKGSYVVAEAEEEGASVESDGEEDGFGNNRRKRKLRAKELKRQSKARKSASKLSLKLSHVAAAELLELVRCALLCVQAGCAHSANSTMGATGSSGFDLQVRYESMMPLCVELVTALPDLQNHVMATACHTAAGAVQITDVVGECLIPSITALAVAVGKDVLWKPLNHKLLMLTRQQITGGSGHRNSASTRLLAIKILHRLFEVVGAEYLILLPECLPFLSELLEEDENTGGKNSAGAQIVASTRSLVQFIENLSGEQLDSYLM